MSSRVQTVALSPGLFLPAGRHHFGGEVETFTERHAGSQALHRGGHAGPERIVVGEADPIEPITFLIRIVFMDALIIAQLVLGPGAASSHASFLARVMRRAK
jgi:hypothetical protein